MKEISRLENVNGSFCEGGASIILTKILNEKDGKTKRKIGKLISEFSAILKHLKASTMTIREKRYIISLVRGSTKSKLNHFNYGEEINTFTRNILTSLYRKNRV